MNYLYLFHFRYLTWFDMLLRNIELTHPGAEDLLRKGAIAVARSFILGALSAVDKTREETFMRFAKSPGGLSGLYYMFPAYQRFCLTTSKRAQFLEKMLGLFHLINDPDSPEAGRYREFETAEIKKSETAVHRAIDSIQSFSNPFTIPDKDKLYSLSSGAAASPEVERNVLRAETVGKTAKQDFIDSRFKESNLSFFDPEAQALDNDDEQQNGKTHIFSSKGN